MKKFEHKYLAPWLHPETGGITFVLLLLTSSAFFFFFSTKHTYEDRRQESITAQQRLTGLQNDQRVLKAYEAGLTDAPQQFNEFRKKQFDRPIALEDVKARLKKWQKQLGIQTLTTQFGGNELVSGELNLWKTPGSIELKVLQDKQFYQFLEKLQQELPGMLIVKSFEVRRVSSLTTALLEQVSTGKGPCLFEGKIEFEWTHLSIDQNTK